MLIPYEKIKGAKVTGKDGDVGKVDDLYFTEDDWIVRYCVVDLGNWLPGRRVLISPVSITVADWDSNAIATNLTNGQIESAPSQDFVQPVSRRLEIEFAKHFDWPYYWSESVHESGGAAIPPPTAEMAVEEEQDGETFESKLRSATELTTYRIEASDGDIGHIESFLFDEETWRMRYVVVDTRNWLPGRKVIVSPNWISSISWSERQMQFDVPKDKIKNAPEMESTDSVTRGYERQLFNYYGSAPYWMPLA